VRVLGKEVGRVDELERGKAYLAFGRDGSVVNIEEYIFTTLAGAVVAVVKPVLMRGLLTQAALLEKRQHKDR
jgi:hypothetical protein